MILLRAGAGRRAGVCGAIPRGLQDRCLNATPPFPWGQMTTTIGIATYPADADVVTADDLVPRRGSPAVFGQACRPRSRGGAGRSARNSSADSDDRARARRRSHPRTLPPPPRAGFARVPPELLPVQHARRGRPRSLQSSPARRRSTSNSTAPAAATEMIRITPQRLLLFGAGLALALAVDPRRPDAPFVSGPPQALDGLRRLRASAAEQRRARLHGRDGDCPAGDAEDVSVETGRHRSGRMADRPAGGPRPCRGRNERARLRPPGPAAVGARSGVLQIRLDRAKRHAGPRRPGPSRGGRALDLRVSALGVRRARLTRELATIAPLLAQARVNLVGQARDLWITGTGTMAQQVADLDALAKSVTAAGRICARDWRRPDRDVGVRRVARATGGVEDRSALASAKTTTTGACATCSSCRSPGTMR